MHKHLLGIEIGGTKQQIAVGTEDGTILEIESVRLGKGTTASDILKWLSEQAEARLKAYPDISGIGIGFGGILESATGRSLCSLQVQGWKDFQLKAYFEDRFSLSVTAVNDTVAGGLAELLCGAGRGSEHFFYTNIGTGIGGGLFVEGQYYDGNGYGASYLGNSLIPDWTKGAPGSVTRLELICSGPSIEKRLRTDGYVPETSELYSLLADANASGAAALSEAAHAGDAFALSEVERIADSFSIGLANVLALEAPQKIAVGGGVAKMGELLFSALRRHTEAHAFIANKGRFEIVPAQLLDNAVPIGALLSAAGKLRS